MMVNQYSQLICLSCGSEYYRVNRSKKPRCGKCGSRKVNVLPMAISSEEMNEFRIWKEQHKNVQMEQTQQPIKEDKKIIDEDLLYGTSHDQNVDQETPESQEEQETDIRDYNYQCGTCGSTSIQFGDLYCHACGSSIPDEFWTQVEGGFDDGSPNT